ncbi:MAG: DUF4145 domain-containing protein [Candidatus Obscuribacterales bacterium]
MLSDLEDLIEEVTPHLRATIPRGPVGFGGTSQPFPQDFRRPEAWVSSNKLFCPDCAADRKVRVRVLLHSGPLARLARATPVTNHQRIDTNEFGPSLLVLICEQCRLQFNCLLFDEMINEETETKILIFANGAGGLATPHTPPEIKHFVNEAYKCQCAGAHGAAIEMYRAALEQLLFTEGFEDRLLSAKLDALETAKNSGTAKPWAADVDVQMLHIMRKLGNEVAHPKTAQSLAAFDAETISGVQEVFQYLLTDIYERNFQQKELLSSFQQMNKNGEE